jgi:YgiT-type zinc finger domain-containing protein
MKCIICSSPDVEQKNVNEEIWVGEDVALIPLRVLVCNNCGERYYDRKAMRQLEEAEKALKDKRLRVETTGRVLRVVTEPTSAIAA